MPESLFISYMFEDREHRDAIARWCRHALVGPDQMTLTESDDLRPLGEAVIERELGPKLRRAAAVVCLIGANTHKSGWIQHQLDLATRLGKKVILVRIPGARGAAPFGHRHRTLYPLDPSLLRQLL